MLAMLRAPWDGEPRYQLGAELKERKKVKFRDAN